MMQPLDGSESLVIDCSVTMSWYFKDEATPYSDAVRAALATQRAAVPALWPLEVANVLLMGERRKRSTQAKATKWLQILATMPIAVDTQTPGLAFDAILDLARSHKLTAYDGAYLELAMRLGVPLATSDTALKKAALAVGVALFTADPLA
jgi:predicted nucleic acid-binding protein